MELGDLIKNYLADDRPVRKSLRSMKSAKDVRLNAQSRKSKGRGTENTNGSEEEVREHGE